MKRTHRRRAAWLAGLVALLILGGGAVTLTVRGDWRYRVLYTLTPAEAAVLSPVSLQGETESRSRHELTGDARVTVSDALMLVNREHPLPDGYAPELTALGDWQMTAEVRAAFEALRERVEAETGERLLIRSAYRSGAEQREELASGGSEVAARPGESEHEAGLALDICIRGFGGQAFLKSAAGQCVNRSCAEEGFVIRYPMGKASVTGFAFEPWHLRYVGKTHAAAMAAGKLTLEEYIAGMTPEQWYAYGDTLILRSAADTVTLPKDFTACTVSPDGCGYRIFTVRP